MKTEDAPQSSPFLVQTSTVLHQSVPRAFIRHRDSTLLVTHLVKQANEGFLGDTAFELPRLSHPHQDGLNLPCSVRANKSDARDYTIARRR